MITYNQLQSTLSSYPTPPTIGLPLWAYSTGARVTEPPDSQKLTGWVPILGQEIGQKPPYQWVNWLSLSTGTWIQYLQSASAQLITDVLELQLNVADLQSRVTVLESKVATLQSQVATLQSQVAFLNSRQTANISGRGNDWADESLSPTPKNVRVRFNSLYTSYNLPDGTWDAVTLTSKYKTTYQVSAYTQLTYEIIVDCSAPPDSAILTTELVILANTPYGTRTVFDQQKPYTSKASVGFNTWKYTYIFDRLINTQSVFLDVGQQFYFNAVIAPNIGPFGPTITILSQVIRAIDEPGIFVISVGF